MRVIFKKNTVTIRCCFYILPEDEKDSATDCKEKQRKLNFCCFYLLLCTCKKRKNDEQ